MTCSGLGGCAGQGAKTTCDNDVAVLGDGCSVANDSACTADHKSLLQCKGESFALVETCKGAGGCNVSGGTHTCDGDLADVADPCSKNGNFACSPDRTSALRCDDGKLAWIQTCRGPRACGVLHATPESNTLDCDSTIAAENDPCAMPDNEACTADKKSIVTCKNGRFTTTSSCVSDCSVTFNGKLAKASCDGAGGAGGADGAAWSGIYRCGADTLRLTQNGDAVAGTTQHGTVTELLTCTIAGSRCAGTYVEKVATTKGPKSPARSEISLTRHPDGRIVTSYPKRPARAATCSK